MHWLMPCNGELHEEWMVVDARSQRIHDLIELGDQYHKLFAQMPAVKSVTFNLAMLFGQRCLMVFTRVPIFTKLYVAAGSPDFCPLPSTVDPTAAPIFDRRRFLDTLELVIRTPRQPHFHFRATGGDSQDRPIFTTQAKPLALLNESQNSRMGE